MCRLSIALALLFAGTTQPQPDFSGHWVLVSPVPAPADAARAIAIEQPVTRTNVRGEPMPPAYLKVTIRRERESGATTDTWQIGIIGGVIGGVITASGQPVPASSSHFETRWVDGSLIFLSRVDGPGGPHTGRWSERQETWSVDPDGRLRVETVTASYDHPEDTRVLVYRRE